MVTKTSSGSDQMTVAKYLSGLMAISEKSQTEIAEEIGYAGRRNMISMIKSGDARLPMNKVGPLAKALHIDAKYLLRLAMREYSPETWAIMEGILDEGWGEPSPTASERRMLSVARTQLNGDDIDMDNPEVAALVEGVFSRIALLQEQQRAAAIERYESASPNAKHKPDASTDA